MQSGTTGINTLRIYSPTKQAQDHDPDGVFIRHWLPELSRVPLALLAQPWRMDAAQQQAAACVIGRDYPAPIVDDKLATQYAKDRLYGLRKTAQAKAEADAVQERHGSRKSGLPNSATRAKAASPKAAASAKSAAAQGSLF